MSNENNDFQDVDEGEEFDLIVLEDDETGESIELVIIDEWEKEEHTYLLVVALSDFENECPDASIIKEFKDEDGEFVYEIVDEDEEFEKASAYFSSLED